MGNSFAVAVVEIVAVAFAAVAVAVSAAEVVSILVAVVFQPDLLTGQFWSKYSWLNHTREQHSCMRSCSHPTKKYQWNK